jgi:hypothetical protein
MPPETIGQEFEPEKYYMRHGVDDVDSSTRQNTLVGILLLLAAVFFPSLKLGILGYLAMTLALLFAVSLMPRGKLKYVLMTGVVCVLVAEAWILFVEAPWEQAEEVGTSIPHQRRKAPTDQNASVSPTPRPRHKKSTTDKKASVRVPAVVNDTSHDYVGPSAETNHDYPDSHDYAGPTPDPHDYPGRDTTRDYVGAAQDYPGMDTTPGAISFGALATGNAFGRDWCNINVCPTCVVSDSEYTFKLERDDMAWLSCRSTLNRIATTPYPIMLRAGVILAVHPAEGRPDFGRMWIPGLGSYVMRWQQAPQVILTGRFAQTRPDSSGPWKGH